jgi:hypothetical protein
MIGDHGRAARKTKRPGDERREQASRNYSMNGQWHPGACQGRSFVSLSGLFAIGSQLVSTSSAPWEAYTINIHRIGMARQRAMLRVSEPSRPCGRDSAKYSAMGIPKSVFL